MQLNDIIEEQSLESISKRTRISQENLEALIARDWSHLKKVQALGFLSILEREYGIDLSDLREECRSYFESHAPQEKRITVSSDEVIQPGSHRLLKILMLILLLLAAYGSWVLFVAENESFESNTTSTTQKESFFDSVKAVASQWFGDKSTAVESESNSGAKAVDKGAWAKEENFTLQSVMKPEEKEAKTSAKEEAETGERKMEAAAATGEAAAREENGSEMKEAEPKKPTENSQEAEEEQIITRVKEEQAAAEQQAEAPAVEVPAEEKGGEISSMIAAATGSGVAESAGETSTESTEETTAQKEEKAKTAAPAPEPQKQKEAPAPAATAKGVVLFHPLAKIWVGYTDLRTMKRVAKTTAAEIPFDTARGDYILATGHGRLEFRQGDKVLLKLNDGKKHFFMIAKGKVQEMSHQAFQRLNKSKVW
ncbi:hypothetical protein [Nitratifractor sp.]